MRQQLVGKIALVTGGTTGIGFATARRFVEEGATVYVTGRRQSELDAAVAKLGPNAIGIRGDVANLADLDRLMATIRDRSGRLDVLFANAGSFTFVPLDAVTEAHYDSLFDTNVKGLVFTVQKALSLMPNGASIILNASIAASKGVEAFSIYSATKAAVRSFARTWTTDLRARRIRVNAISPGPIATEGFESVAGGKEAAEQMHATMAAGVPHGRVGTADEVAAAVLFLASPESSYVTGVELFVDGGMAQV